MGAITLLARARGALYGLAIGDALGMPTQLLSRAEIRGRWGDLLTGFEPAPPGHPIAAGMPAGAVTDDTEQAVLLGRLLVSGHGTIDPNEFASALVSWERDMAGRGRRTSSAPPLSAPWPRSWPAPRPGKPARRVTPMAPPCG